MYSKLDEILKTQRGVQENQAQAMRDLNMHSIMSTNVEENVSALGDAVKNISDMVLHLGGY